MNASLLETLLGFYNGTIAVVEDPWSRPDEIISLCEQGFLDPSKEDNDYHITDKGMHLINSLVKESYLIIAILSA